VNDTPPSSEPASMRAVLYNWCAALTTTRTRTSTGDGWSTSATGPTGAVVTSTRDRKEDVVTTPAAGREPHWDIQVTHASSSTARLCVNTGMMPVVENGSAVPDQRTHAHEWPVQSKSLS
jgi:hypothetical protein